MKRGLMAGALLAPATLLCSLPAVSEETARARGPIEEIVVTATKRESTLQDAAVSVSAFDQRALDREKIAHALDIQMSVPNLHMTKSNFSEFSVAIRGIGRSVVAVSGDSGVGIHFNGSYLHNSSIFESEFFDVERVEILRGPQGTLYGRNTTGGVFNIIPARPGDSFDASIDAQFGNFDTRKGRAMVNVPVTDGFQLRLSGMMLDRDGYTKNTFTGRRIDDRDLWALRVGARFTPSENTELNVFYQHFDEDDRRMRTSNQTCTKDTRPFPFNLGCLPGHSIESAQVLNSNAQLGGILANIFGLYPFGTDAFANTARHDDLRKVQAAFDPLYQLTERIANAQLTHSFGDYVFTMLGSRQRMEYYTETDYAWAVPSVPFQIGVLPTPSDPRVSGFDRPFGFDTMSLEGRSWTTEARLQSDWRDSPWDFLAGIFYMDHRTDDSSFDVRGNTLAFLTPVQMAQGAPIAFFRNNTSPYELETWALFGELYYDWTPRTRMTLGLRYSDEEKSLRDRQTLLNNPLLPEHPGVSNRAFLNLTLAPFMNAIGVTHPLFHGFGTSGNDPVPSFREFSDSWNELTGKVGLEYDADVAFADRALLFATLARSYKSGGINPPSFTGAFAETFEPEYVNSIELGAKSRMMDGHMQLNLTYFFYDYEGLQTTKIIDRTSVNENVDARIHGLEAELIFVPIDNLRIDAFGAWLRSEIRSGFSVNPANPTNGNPNWLAAKNFGADVFLVPAPGTGQTFNPADCNGRTLECGAVFSAPPVDVVQTSPTWGQLVSPLPALVQIPTGIPVDVAGNRLPQTPRFSVKLGAQYSFHLPRNLELVPRLDFYFQGETYYRIYNSVQDRIPSWTVWNASLSLFGEGGRWHVEGFVKNLLDDDHITGAYFADYSSANFTNVFILEPRTFGVLLGYRF
jgi:iron complex outermembrane recepter protein